MNGLELVHIVLMVLRCRYEESGTDTGNAATRSAARISLCRRGSSTCFRSRYDESARLLRAQSARY